MLTFHDGDEAAYLAAIDRYSRAQQARLTQHPDCRDPDHPGCAKCNEEKDDEIENTESA